MGAAAFDLADEPMHAILWIYLDQKVDVIGHPFQFDDFAPSRGGRLSDENFQPRIHGLDQDRTPVFRAPNHVVFAGINHVVVALVGHSLDYTACLGMRPNHLISPWLKSGAL